MGGGEGLRFVCDMLHLCPTRAVPDAIQRRNEMAPRSENRARDLGAGRRLDFVGLGPHREGHPDLAALRSQ
jgi:hypothetical protein